MMSEDLAKLNRAVAEALGWKLDCTGKLLDSDQQFKSWGSDYRPSTNGQQAMDLAKKYKIGFLPYEHRKGIHCDQYYIAYWTGAVDSVHHRRFEEGATPEIAICKAVIAMKESENG